jgi:hypothetical protein
VKPDGTSVNYTATTGKVGQFELDVNLTDVGSWSFIAFYNGEDHKLITYNPTYTQYSTIQVDAAPIQPIPTPTPVPTETPTIAPTENPTATPTIAPTSSTTTGNIPTEYIYAIVAVIVIIVIAIGAYVFLKKKPASK